MRKICGYLRRWGIACVHLLRRYFEDSALYKKIYDELKASINRIFDGSPFYTYRFLDELAPSLQENREYIKERLEAKLQHIRNVAGLMEKAAKSEGLGLKKILMAYAIGLFHDIATIPDIAMSGKEYGPRHGARGAAIACGLLLKKPRLRRLHPFSGYDVEIICTVIANHDVAVPKKLKGVAAKMLSLLRDCDKVDCYRRLSTEPLAPNFQTGLEWNASIRIQFAEDCLAGKPMRYADMQNSNEEALLYSGWFFQLQNVSCQRAAYASFVKFAKRILKVTQDADTRDYVNRALEKAREIVEPDS